MNTLKDSTTHWEAKPWFKWDAGMKKLPAESTLGRRHPDFGDVHTRVLLFEQIRRAYVNVAEMDLLGHADKPDRTEIRIRFNDKSKVKITTKNHRRSRAFDILILTLEANSNAHDRLRKAEPDVTEEAYQGNLYRCVSYTGMVLFVTALSKEGACDIAGRVPNASGTYSAVQVTSVDQLGRQVYHMGMWLPWDHKALAHMNLGPKEAAP